MARPPSGLGRLSSTAPPGAVFFTGLAIAAACATGLVDVADVAGLWLAPFHCGVAVLVVDAATHARHGRPRDGQACATLPKLSGALSDAARHWAGLSVLLVALTFARADVGATVPAAHRALAALSGAITWWGAAEGVASGWHSLAILRSTTLPEGDDDLA